MRSGWVLRVRRHVWRLYLAIGGVAAALYFLFLGQDLAGAVLFLAVLLSVPLAAHYGRLSAFYDPLTRLPNRALFTDRLGQALAAAGRGGSPVMVLLMDLDGFKPINDTLGHRAGDQLLVAFAERLRSCVRPSDTVARVGGDEFAVLIPEGTIETGQSIARRVAEETKAPFVLAGREVYTAASVGIAETGAGQSASDVMRNAGAAMYSAKKQGGGSFEVYRPKLHGPLLERLELGTDLRQAVEQVLFVIHYQPIVTLPAGDIMGVEALVRWEHPERGLIPPLDFIPLAEEAGLIVAIDRWVLEEACRQAQLWNEDDGGQPLTMHVNMSARQLHDKDLAAHVSAALDASGFDPQKLTMEITEGVLVEDTEATVRALGNLRDLGVQVAIDDFGIGFSSLSYLRQLPVDVVKIDRSFVVGVGTHAEEWSLARGIIRLVHSLGLQTVAEGIEQADQVAHLSALGCRYGQGFFFARPAPSGQVSGLLKQGRLAGGVRSA